MRYLGVWILCLVCVFSHAQQPGKLHAGAYSLAPVNDSIWVDSVFRTLTPQQRIAQLFMVAVNPNDAADLQRNLDLVSNTGVGGVIFFKGHPTQIATQINKLQQAAHIPLLVGIDGEWGLAMRMDSVPDYPKQMMLGAIQNDSLIYRMGLDIGAQCKRMGIQIDFAPDADVNINPLNPIINYRSFGEDKTRVARKAIAYMEGLQDEDVIACAKHFPGHGDVSQDSHLTLPTVTASRARIDSVELYPFRELIKNGCLSIMVAHLNVPALTGDNTTPTTLSSKVVTGLLKQQYSFKGLVFTDALNMKGVANSFPPGVVDAKALIAGNDVLLYSQDVNRGISEILNAIERGEMSQQDVDAHVKKILAAKVWCHIKKQPVVDTKNLYDDLNTDSYKKLWKTLVENSMTVVKNSASLIPLKKQKDPQCAVVSIDDGKITYFQGYLRTMCTYANYPVNRNATAIQLKQTAQKLLKYKTVIISLHHVNTNILGAYKVSPAVVAFVKQLSATKHVVLVDFGSPYALKYFEGVPAMLCAYTDDPYAQACAARVLAGKLGATGRLPVSASAALPVNSGVDISARPYVFNMQGAIDSICINAINEGAFPGCRVMAYHGDSVLFDKSYGHYTYDEASSLVTDSTLYDLASVTKTAATTLAAMRLYEQGKLDIHKTIGDYLPGWDTTNKAHITVFELMTHTGGLKAWIPFYKKTLNTSGYPDTTLYCTNCDTPYCVCITPRLFMRRDYLDTMWNTIRLSPVGAAGKYLYSDLDFIFMQKIVETISGQSLDKYVTEQFYKPMHLTRIFYNPLQHIAAKYIAPTTQDVLFRQQEIQGTVHDPAAAMLGGVAGHAGLFATAHDLAAIYLMLMNKGTYHGVSYFKPETVELFTKQQIPGIRRGLGFDRPDKYSGTSYMASDQTFGHTGFTGTCVWADPVNNLVYVFLSNRTYPSEADWKILSLGVRGAIHDALYNEINHVRN